MSFVEICTGINLATASWPKFQQQLKLAEKRAANIIRATIASKADDTTLLSGAAAKAVNKNMEPWIGRLRKWWKLAYRTSIILALAGLAMLYMNVGCPWDFLLLLPTIIYLAGSQWVYWRARKKAKVLREALQQIAGQLPEKTHQALVQLEKALESTTEGTKASDGGA